jgi:hypothetical protein
VACSPQANYTDRAAALVSEVSANFLRIEGVAWSAQRIPAAVNLSFQDRFTVRYELNFYVVFVHYFCFLQHLSPSILRQLHEKMYL